MKKDMTPDTIEARHRVLLARRDMDRAKAKGWAYGRLQRRWRYLTAVCAAVSARHG